MKIGYFCEDSTHEAFVRGLKKRWCPSAELVQGRFRGSTGTSLRREYRKTCEELFTDKSVDVVVILTDSDVGDWSRRFHEERAKLPSERHEQIILGLPDRNIECWLTCDRIWMAEELSVGESLFDCDDPKGPFDKAMRISRNDRKINEISALVGEAPLGNWLKNSKSFEKFYDQARDISQRRSCNIENIRDKQ